MTCNRPAPPAARRTALPGRLAAVALIALLGHILYYGDDPDMTSAREKCEALSPTGRV